MAKIVSIMTAICLGLGFTNIVLYKNNIGETFDIKIKED